MLRTRDAIARAGANPDVRTFTFFFDYFEWVIRFLATDSCNTCATLSTARESAKTP